jgi:hypothetical protein
MRIKLNHEKVKSYIEGKEGNGCKLLSTEYINNYTGLSIQCACGNEFKTIFASFPHMYEFFY